MPITNKMVQPELDTITEPNRVNPVSIVSTHQIPKVFRPIPVTNKVLISFDEGEDSADSTEFSGRRAVNCPISFSQASGLSFQNDNTATVSSTTMDEVLTNTKARKKSNSGSLLNQFEKNNKDADNPQRLEHKTCGDYGEKEHKQNQARGKDYCNHDSLRLSAQGTEDSCDGVLYGKKMNASRASFLCIEDIDSIPPASIRSIESPAIKLRPDSPRCMTVSSSQNANSFLSQSLHIRSSTNERSNDSTASGSHSSIGSSKEDDPTVSTSLPSFQSSDSYSFQDRAQCSASASASSSSSVRSDDVACITVEPKQKSDRRRMVREQKRVLRLFDRRQHSTDIRDITDNPWFQAMAADSKLEEYQVPSQTQSYLRNIEHKGRRTKLSKLGRSLKSQGKRKKLEQEDTTDPTCHGKETVSMSVSSSSSLLVAKYSTEITIEELRHALRRALSGKRSLDEVLECMMRVYSRPPDNFFQLLYKYFSCGKTIESSMKWITEELRVLQEDISDGQLSKGCEAYIILSRIYREILLQIFTSGPSTVKKAFLHNKKVRSSLIRFFRKDIPQGRLELKSWAKTSVAVFRILSSLMSEHASDVVLFLSSKDGLLSSLISKYICFPEVVSFVSKLCAADALSESSDCFLRYGPPNADGILLLAKENIVDTLAHAFIDSCNSRSGNSSDLTLEIQRNSLQCLKEISFKAVTMPKFGKTNCSMNPKQIKMLNTALETIPLYSATNHLQAGIEYSLKRLFESSDANKTHSNVFESNYPLSRILSLSSDLLEAVLVASESKKFAVRRTIGMVSTKNLEWVLLSKLDDLCGLLDRKGATRILSTTRLFIIQLLKCLFASNQNNIWDHLYKKKVPELLLTVIDENEFPTMIHKAVIECFESSLRRKDAVLLHKQWIENLGKHHGWTNEMHRIAENQKSRGIDAQHCRSQIQCTYVQITTTLMDIANSEYNMNLDSFFATHGVNLPCMGKLEIEIARIRDEHSKPCGGPKPDAKTVSVLACAEYLAARLDDVNAV
ncbi:unnamed protein product [Agarophyton chilense]